MVRDIALLVNPQAAQGGALRHLSPVAERLRAGGARVRVLHGRDPDEARKVAAEAVAERPDALVTLGGDGLVNLALQALAGSGVPLGIVPAGSGNDIARELGVPRRAPLAAVDVVLDGTVRTIDAGRCNGRYFASVVCCGFDSRVTERANRMRRLRGQARYAAAVAGELRVFRPLPFTIDVDGQRWETEAMMVAVGNTRAYGGGMQICPQACDDDGLLDLTIIGAVSRPGLVRAFPRVYRGSHLTHPAVATVRGREVTLTVSDVTAYADGEPFGAAPITCEAVPGALRVLVPGS